MAPRNSAKLYIDIDIDIQCKPCSLENQKKEKEKPKQGTNIFSSLDCGLAMKSLYLYRQPTEIRGLKTGVEVTFLKHQSQTTAVMRVMNNFTYTAEGLL